MTEAAKAKEKPVVEKDERNGVVRPKAGTKTGTVWEIADRISAERGEPASRRDVMEAGVGAGVNGSTVATQYGRWRKYHGLKAEPRGRKTTAAAAEDTTVGADEE